jgi:uncharacterized SAM-binding protein YcdF (DUF218 family)
MDFAKKSVEIIFSPLGITSILIGIGIILSCTGKHTHGSRRLMFLGGLLFLTFLFSPISEFLILQLEQNYPPMLIPPASPKIDRIVVLAGYSEEHRGFPITTMVSEHTICTMSEGLRLYRLLPGAKLIMSGGVGRKGERPVAAAMSDFLQQMGVPAPDIVVEGRSRNTFENLAEVKKLVGPAPFILVAQACDLPRANAVARKLQMNPIAAPACHWALQYHANKGTADEIGKYIKSFCHPSTDNLFRIQWAYHEYVGYAWYRLLGRI